MAFDAGMVAAVTHELQNKINGARIEKIQQPEKDEIIIQLHISGEKLRLLISASAGNPRIYLTSFAKENPLQAPMFCMLLRKHLTGAKIGNVHQLGFERAVEIELNTYDEMGFAKKKYLIAEIMGKYSNIILCDEEHCILGAIKIVDFTTSQKRQVLCGMKYQAPPLQNKISPLSVEKDDFEKLLFEKYGNNCDAEKYEKFITSSFYGISTVVARDIANRAFIASLPLWNVFNKIMDIIKKEQFIPILVQCNGVPRDYFFYRAFFYGGDILSAADSSSIHCKTRSLNDESDSDVKNCYSEALSFCELLDNFFLRRDQADRLKQHSADISHMIQTIENRLNKKISIQSEDLKNCSDKEKYLRMGDLITSNMWRIKKGMEKALLVDYYSPNMDNVEVPLDSKLSPTQNAQKYYKRYNKSKAAEVELTKQLNIAKSELEYIKTVADALTRCETEQDISDIRDELSNSTVTPMSVKKNIKAKKNASKPIEYITSGGFSVICGKNNTQNDYLTFKTATKHDWWFHVKNMPGSHVVMVCDSDTEPSADDFSDAAMIAAYNSKAFNGVNVAVDYTKVKNIKKPSGSKPGYVTYSSNWTAYVTPNAELIAQMRKK